MDYEKASREIMTTASCVLYGFLFGYLASEMLYSGEVRIGIVAGGAALGYFLKVFLLPEVAE